MHIQETGHVQINIVFNLSWHEVCTGLENKCQRVGAWLPSLI